MVNPPVYKAPDNTLEHETDCIQTNGLISHRLGNSYEKLARMALNHLIRISEETEENSTKFMYIARPD